MVELSSTQRTSTPFRFDHIGSFLRSQHLKVARKDLLDGKISKEKLTKIEDEEIITLVQ
jgi:methionine synthase II (cobalamin-independent)